jgi:hypothetical protein
VIKVERANVTPPDQVLPAAAEPYTIDIRR